MDMVFEHLNLLEKDYYGLTFSDADSQKVSGYIISDLLSCEILCSEERAAFHLSNVEKKQTKEKSRHFPGRVS